jgi:(aminoalkyl)phosphonate N-acetyltransferase
MHIRRAEESDYEQVIALYNLFVGEDRYSRYDNDSFQKVLKSDSNYVFVIEEEKKIIAFATFSIRYVIRYPRPIAELDELFVLSDYRHQGLGKQLIEKVEDLAKEKNCHRVYIESQYRFKGAHAFYEKLGYKNYGYHFIKNL